MCDCLSLPSVAAEHSSLLRFGISYGRKSFENRSLIDKTFFFVTYKLYNVPYNLECSFLAGLSSLVKSLLIRTVPTRVKHLWFPRR